MITAQTLYINALIKQAEILLRQSDTLAFDPQGRVLIEVRLNSYQLQTLMSEINNNSEMTHSFSLNEAGLEQALGRKPSPITTISLDITAIPDLNERFSSLIAPNIQQKIARVQGSIIPLQQEFYFHLALVGRIYQQVKPILTDALMSTVHKQAMLAVNTLVITAFNEAVVKATKSDGSINSVLLNKALDKARKELLPQAHQAFMHELVRHSGVIFSKDELKKVGTHSLKHLAEATTATANDLLHTDSARGLATLITGTESTAHNRVAGESFAHRQIITYSLATDGNVDVHPHPRIQIRTPSPVLKTGLASDAEYAADVAIKLEAATAHYQLAAQLEVQANKQRAFIYNSYTAINDGLGDTGGNLQTQSAHHILQGAHLYNTRALSEPQGIICLVQNISVNGFGDSLGYGSNTLQNESTLMTEMALLHTLHDVLLAEDKEQVNELINSYAAYLQNRAAPYFSQSAEGIEAIVLISNLKNKWQKQIAPNTNNLFTHAQLALQQMMAHNLHCSHDYAKLFQTLSVIVEQASLGGCKSGNERAQAINGRVAVFDELVNSDKPSAIKELLERVAQQERGAVKALKFALDHEYNQRGLQGAASLISLVDQGASAKVEGKPDHPFYISRNYGEEPSSVMTNLQQSKAGKMQAHKELTKHMKAVWEGHPKGWWARMNDSPLGIVGAVLGVLTIIPALAVAVYGAIDNAQRKTQTEEANQELMTAFGAKALGPCNGSARALGALNSDELMRVPSSSFYNIADNINDRTPTSEHSPTLNSSNDSMESIESLESIDSSASDAFHISPR